MRRTQAVFGLATFLLAAFGFAELSPRYRDWPQGPAGLLITKRERKEYGKLGSDAAAERFIALFWARRDPAPETSVNEFERDFELRVAAADSMYGFGRVPGWDSDRGRTLLLMGKPSRRSIQGAAQRTDELPGAGAGAGGSTSGAGSFAEAGGIEIWEYGPEALPPGVKSRDVLFIFRESRPGYGDYVLDRGDSRNAQALSLLAAAPRAHLLHPGLAEVPSVGLVAGSRPATADQLAVFAAADRPWPEGAGILSAEAVLSSTDHPLWLWLQLPGGVPPASEAVGRVREAGSGNQVGTFALAVRPVAVGAGHGYELSLPLDVGKFEIDVALLSAGAPVAVRTTAANVTEVPAESEFISPFLWGADVRQEPGAGLGDPFNVGGWHIIPTPGSHFTTDESLNYFCTILRPTLDEGGVGRFRVTLALYIGERKLTETPPQAVKISHIGGDLWMFGNALPLVNFRQGGDFKLVVTLKDTLSNVSASSEIPLAVEKVVEKDEAEEKPGQQPG